MGRSETLTRLQCERGLQFRLDGGSSAETEKVDAARREGGLLGCLVDGLRRIEPGVSEAGSGEEGLTAVPMTRLAISDSAYWYLALAALISLTRTSSSWSVQAKRARGNDARGRGGNLRSVAGSMMPKVLMKWDRICRQERGRQQADRLVRETGARTRCMTFGSALTSTIIQRRKPTRSMTTMVKGQPRCRRLGKAPCRTSKR